MVMLIAQEIAVDGGWSYPIHMSIVKKFRRSIRFCTFFNGELLAQYILKLSNILLCMLRAVPLDLNSDTLLRQSCLSTTP